MAETLSTIQSKVSSLVDQSITPPTSGGSEWNIRTTFINRSIKEWSESYDWEALRGISFPTVSGGATISLPADFKKMSAYPVYYCDAYSEGAQWPEIQPNEIMQHRSNDNYYYVIGNKRDGFSMIWNPGTLVSGASIMIQYWKEPSELSSDSDVTECPNTEFVINRTIAYIFEARSDPRFQETEAKARDNLLQMVDNENAKSAAYLNNVSTPEKLYYNFRLGRD